LRFGNGRRQRLATALVRRSARSRWQYDTKHRRLRYWIVELVGNAPRFYRALTPVLRIVEDGRAPAFAPFDWRA